MSDLPFDFFHPHVVRTRQLSPNLLRVVLGGAGLARVVSGGRDQRFKLFLPHPGRPAPVLPDVLDADWYARWRALDPGVRAVMRTYTVSAVRREPPEIDVDFALHGDLGPASRWAARARPGDGVALLAPVTADNGGISFCPPAGTGWVLLAADETALPAVANILAALPSALSVRAFVEVGHPDDRVPLPTKADAEITWLVRTGHDRLHDRLHEHSHEHSHDRTTALLDAVTAARIPEGAVPYAWLAGESGCVRALRRHLVSERGLDRKAVSFTGYWRQGRTEDDLLTEAIAAAEEAHAAEAEQVAAAAAR